MASKEKDVPVSPDYQKSTAGGGFHLPDFLMQKTGAVIGLGFVVVVAGVIYGMSHVDVVKLSSNPLESRPGFTLLKQHVESLAEVDGLCAKEDRMTCLCELADRIREDRKAIDSLLANDPSLRAFQIAIRRPASVTVSYDLTKLPQAPGETDCLNAVAAPTIIDEE